MENDDQDFWFPRKDSGLGWGLPVAWQGWCVLGVYSVLVGLAIVLKHTMTQGAFLMVLGMLTALLVAICLFKGE